MLRGAILGLLVASIGTGAAVLPLGCRPREDVTPQIAVTPGAAKRIALVPSRYGRTVPTSGDAAAPAPARVHPLAKGDELGGPNATGRVGDWILENDEVVFVIDGLGRGSGFAESGGNVIDAADARSRKDELGQLFTYFGTFPRQGVYGTIDSHQEPDGTAVVVAKGKDLYESSIAVTTEYRLAGGDRALLLRTTLTNTGSAVVRGLGLGDAIQWGGAEKFAPGKPLSFKGPSKGPFVGGIGRFVSYAITSTDGEIGAVSGGSWTDTLQRDNVAIDPGQSVTYERVFVVGERPDSASVVSELTRAASGPVGALEVALVDERGAKVAIDPGAKVLLGTPTANDVMSLVASASGEAFGGDVPPGTWTVTFAPSVGRRAAKAGVKSTVTVKADAVAKVSLVVSDAASATFGACTEASTAVPCKLTLEGQGGTATPDFGPGHVAGPAKNTIILGPSDVVRVPLAHGRYRVTASRGPEYDLTTTDIDVGPGSTAGTADAPLRLALRHVVETPGYVATDFHQHTILSADAPVATRDRVLANAAEGVEVAVASEHNAVVDLGQVIRDQRLASFVVSIPGNELTSDASKTPWGHANVFPLEVRAKEPRGGALVVRDRKASELFAEARALAGGPRVIQVNHPRSGKNGYFDQLGFDPKTGVGTGAGYDATFDAIEVWNGRVAHRRDAVLDDYFALLRTGHPVTPIADTDTHGIVGEEAGYPRTYVRVQQDVFFAAWDGSHRAEIVGTIRERRDVVLTNGPFVRVTANGAGIGGLARPRGGIVDVQVTIETASWTAVEKVGLRFAGGAKVEGGPSEVAVSSTTGLHGELVSRVAFKVRASADDAFVVIASGSRPMRPVLSGDDADITPWAMTAPIWIDADGDGRALGRKAPR